MEELIAILNLPQVPCDTNLDRAKYLGLIRELSPARRRLLLDILGVELAADLCRAIGGPLDSLGEPLTVILHPSLVNRRDLLNLLGIVLFMIAPDVYLERCFHGHVPPVPRYRDHPGLYEHYHGLAKHLKVDKHLSMLMRTEHDHKEVTMAEELQAHHADDELLVARLKADFTAPRNGVIRWKVAGITEVRMLELLARGYVVRRRNGFYWPEETRPTNSVPVPDPTPSSAPKPDDMPPVAAESRPTFIPPQARMVRLILEGEHDQAAIEITAEAANRLLATGAFQLDTDHRLVGRMILVP